MSVTIIAEAGLNFSNYSMAFDLVKKAKECEADIVKFQTHFDWEYPMLSKTEWRALKMLCDDIGIIFMSTAWSFEAIDFLAEIGMTHWKIPSSECRNKEYIDKINSKNPEIVYVSNGFGDRINTVEYSIPMNKTKLMRCISKYPTNINEIVFENMFNYGQGMSDHTDNIYAPIIAVSHGAKVIEKHFCLLHPCIDDSVSITPDKFKEMVDVIRQLENYKEPVIPPEILALKNRVQS